MTHLLRDRKDASSSTPWLAPVLLLLEVMAQLTSITLDDEIGDDKPANKKSEYGKLVAEHKSLNKKQTSMMKHVYASVTKDSQPKKKKPKSAKSAFMFFSVAKRASIVEANPDASFGDIGKLVGRAWKDLDDKTEYEKMAADDAKRYKKEMAEYKKNPNQDKKTSGKTDSDTPAASAGGNVTEKEKATGGDVKEKEKPAPPPSTISLPPIPLLQAMMHTETQEACMLLCLQLLGLKSKKGVIDKVHLEKVCPQDPTVVNAILVLLVRLLRSRPLASLCLNMGGADLMLALPSRSYFSGNRDLISLILRRMLEDEVTLHSMMETEIRSIVAKIYKRQHPSHGATAQQRVNLKTFMQACTPLIIRDSVVFFKAVVSSVELNNTGTQSSSLASSRGKFWISRLLYSYFD